MSGPPCSSMKPACGRSLTAPLWPTPSGSSSMRTTSTARPSRCASRPLASNGLCAERMGSGIDGGSGRGRAVGRVLVLAERDGCLGAADFTGFFIRSARVGLGRYNVVMVSRCALGACTVYVGSVRGAWAMPGSLCSAGGASRPTSPPPHPPPPAIRSPHRPRGSPSARAWPSAAPPRAPPTLDRPASAPHGRGGGAQRASRAQLRPCLSRLCCLSRAEAEAGAQADSRPNARCPRRGTRGRARRGLGRRGAPSGGRGRERVDRSTGCECAR